MSSNSSVTPTGAKSEVESRESASVRSVRSMKSSPTVATLEERWEASTRDHCGSRLVMSEANWFRVIWNGIVCLLLIYTGTVFLYRVCFLDFRIHKDESSSSEQGWKPFDEIVNVAFWLDLFFNFFFTYRDVQGFEVDSLRSIAKRYLSGYFVVNLLACTPEAVVSAVLHPLLTMQSTDNCSGCTAAVRIARLQRVSRLARLTRLVRLSKITRLNLPKWLVNMRGVRITNNAIGLLWAVHLLACGWYVCAAFHDRPEETWVGRRWVGFDDEGDDVYLISQSPRDQYIHAFYFVLTVFTTVGFGDMSAVTIGEIVYICFMMLVGAVLHSVIISEVITVVTSVDKTQELADHQAQLVEAFAEHTELDSLSEQMMTSWVKNNAKGWVTSRYDRSEMKTLITDKCVPRPLLERLPTQFFGGRLIMSDFLRCGPSDLPHRLPLLLALAVTRADFDSGDLVYQMHDLAPNAFLVLSGTFADVGRPSPEGGVDEAASNTTISVVANALSPKPHKLEDSEGVGSKGLTRMFVSGRDWDDEASRCPSQTMVHSNNHHLYPYKLYSANSYFGLFEVIQNKDGRVSTVRCEAEGSVLMLSKQDYHKLAQEFPQFGKTWALEAQRREALRGRMLGRLTSGMFHRRLAVTRIQQFIRQIMVARGNRIFMRKSRRSVTNSSFAGSEEGASIKGSRASPLFTFPDTAQSPGGEATQEPSLSLSGRFSSEQVPVSSTRSQPGPAGTSPESTAATAARPGPRSTGQVSGDQQSCSQQGAGQGVNFQETSSGGGPGKPMRPPPPKPLSPWPVLPLNTPSSLISAAQGAGASRLTDLPVMLRSEAKAQQSSPPSSFSPTPRHASATTAEAASASAMAQDIQALTRAQEASARESQELRLGMAALRADLASLREDLLTAVSMSHQCSTSNAVGRATSGSTVTTLNCDSTASF